MKRPTHRWMLLVIVFSWMLGLTGFQSAQGQEPSAPKTLAAPEAPEAIAAVADDTFWNNDDLVAGVGSTVKSMAYDSSGDLYVAGYFRSAGGKPSSRIAKWDGVRWTDISQGLGGAVPSIDAIAVTDGFVYAVGGFNTVNGEPSLGIARWNKGSKTWTSLATSSQNSGFYAVAAVQRNGDDDVYVGGNFTQIDGVNANRIAKFRGGTWSALGSGVSGGDFPAVRAISVDQSLATRISVGGEFSAAGGVTARNVAIWNGSSWSSLGSGSSNGVNGPVYFVEIKGAAFVNVGGFFSQAGTVAAGSMARWNGGSSWEALGGRGTTGIVRSFADTAVDLFAVGSFTSVTNSDGTVVNARSFARFNESSGTWRQVRGGLSSGTAWAMIYTRSTTTHTVFVGGSFSSADGLLVNNVARLDPEFTFAPTTPFNQRGAWFGLSGSVDGPNALVRATELSTDGNKVFVGGLFRAAGGAPASNIAAFDRSTRTWSPLGNFVHNGTNGLVRDIAVAGSNVFVVGDFTSAGNNTPAASVAQWNGTDWIGLATSINGNVNTVFADGGDVYVGGDFTQINGIQVNHVARWNGTTWSALGTGVSGDVNAILVHQGNVYVGGDFDEASGVPASNIARFATGSGTWHPLAGGTNNDVHTISRRPSGELVVGGDFSRANNVTDTSRVALWNEASATWTALGEGIGDNSVFTSVTRGNDIYIGGDFESPFYPVKYLARWNGTAWVPLGSGTNDTVFDLALFSNILYVGGEFTLAGDQSSRYFAEWAQPAVDLDVRISDSPDPVVIGNQLTYSVLVRNLGDVDAPNTVLTQSINSSLVVNSIVLTPGGTCPLNGTTITCQLGTVVAGGSKTLTVNVTPSAAGGLQSTASVTSSTAEPITTNNTRSVRTLVTLPGNPVPEIDSLSPAQFVASPFSIPPPPPVRVTVNGSGFVPGSKVRVDGVEATTTFISGNKLEFFKSSTSRGTFAITVFNPAPGGGESNSVSLRVTQGLLGVSSVTPNIGNIDPGITTTFTLSWTHTTKPWRIMDTLEMRLVDDEGVALWAQFTEGITGTFVLLDAEGVPVGVGEPGTPNVLGSDTVDLLLADSSFEGSGPTGFSVEVTFTVRFKQPAAGRRYRIELYATDDDGDIQGPDIGGEFTVGMKTVYVPLVVR